MNISQQHLQDILLKGKVDATTYALPTRLLGSPAIDALSTKYLQDEQLALEHYEIQEPDSSGHIKIAGTGTKLPFTGMKVEATFQFQAGEAQLKLQASGLDGWNLGKSFPFWQGSLLAQLEFSTLPQLSLASYDASEEVKQGRLFFAGTLRLTSLLRDLSSLFGLQGPRLAGAIEIQHGLPAAILAASIVEPIDLGLSTRPQLIFEACSLPFLDANNDHLADAEVFLRFRTELPLKVQGKETALPLLAVLDQPDSDITLSLDLERVSGTLLMGLEELSSLAQGVNFAQHLPALPSFHLAELITLRNIFVRINPTASSKLVSLGISIENTRPWTLLHNPTTGKTIALERFALGIDVPLTSALPTVAISGALRLGEQGLLVLSLFAPDFAVVGGLEPGQTVKLKEVIADFLDEASTSGLPDLEVREFIFAAQVGKQYALSLDVLGDWPLPLEVVDVRLREVKASLLYTQDSGLRATLSSSLTLGGVDFTLTASNTGATAVWTFRADVAQRQPILLSRVLQDLLPGTGKPDELPDLEFSDIAIQFTPSTGAFSVHGTCTTKWELPFGVPDLTVSTVTLALARQDDGQLTCSLALHTQGNFPIVEGLVFERLDLAFALDQVKKAWSLSGSVRGTLFERDFTLAVSLETTSTTRTIMLLAESTQGIELDLGAGSSLTANRLAILISKTLAPMPALPEGKIGGALQLNSSSVYNWAVSTTGALTVAGVDELSSSGTLSLSKQNGRVELVFAPTRATATFSLPEPLPDCKVSLGLQYLVFARTSEKNGQSSWSIQADVSARLSGLPPKLVAVLPTTTVDAQLKIDQQGAAISIVPLVAQKEIEWSLPAFGTLPEIDLGTAVIAVPRLDLSLGKNLALAVEFGIGIPEKTNAIFGSNVDGTPKLRFFKTYEKGKEDSLTRFSLGLDTVLGLQVQIRSSPLQAIHFTQDKQGNPLYTADLGEFGYLEFSLPIFSYNGGTFRGSHASFKQGTDPTTGQPRPLKLPLTPFKWLLEACKLDDLARKIPVGLPLQDIQIYRKGQFNQPATFDGAAFDAVLKSIGDPAALAQLDQLITQLTGTTLTLGQLLEGGLHEFGNLLDQLPDSLIDYLDIEIPKEFRFDLNFTDSGSLQFSVYADPAIKLLYPTIGPLGPQINGLTLRSFSLGELFSGALLPLALDMDLHQFPLIPLIAALLHPSDALPRPQDLTTHLAIHNLYMLIITETGIPLPVPLFFDQLGIEYRGIENLNFQVHSAFPNPFSTLGLSDFIKLLKALGRFITDKDYLLDATALPHLLPVFTLRPNTIQLPPYLGGKSLVNPGDPRYNLVLDANESVFHLLNFLKTLNLNQIIQSIPLENRVGQQHVSFASLEMDADWLVTRPTELQMLTPAQQAIAKLTASEVAALLQLLPLLQVQMVADGLSQLPTRAADGEEQGLVIFLKGSWQIASTVSLLACFGLVEANSGFGTALSFAGRVADLIDLELSGLVAINKQARPGTPVVNLQGKSVLRILKQEIFSGSLALVDRRFTIDGVLNLPFGWSGLLGTVSFSGHLSETELALNGSTSLSFGPFTLASATLTITQTGLTITGIWLQQSMIFSAHQVADQLLFLTELAPLRVGKVIAITGTSPQGGPAASLALQGGSIPSLALDGTIALPLIQCQGTGTLRVRREGFFFSVTSKLFGSAFGATLSVTGTDLQDAVTFVIEATLDSDLLSYLQQNTTAVLNSQLQAVDQQLQALRQQFQQAQQKVNDAQAALDQARQAFQQKIAQAQRNLEEKQQIVRQAQQMLNQANLDFFTKLLLEKELATYEEALSLAQQTFNSVRNDAIRAILQPAEDVLSLASQGFQTVQQAVSTFEQAHRAAIDAFNYTAQYSLAALLSIQSASFTIQYSALSTGRVPLLTVKLVYAGHPMFQQIDFDFSHPEGATQTLARKLLS